MKNKKGPKVLLIDIETLPLEIYCWGIFEQNIGVHQIKHDWSILSWSALWLDDPVSKIMYEDNRHSKNIRDDKKLLKNIHKLMDEADVILGQNSDAFDIKRLNARFIMNNMTPPSPYKTIDTKKIAKKYFNFTSNSLDFMTSNLNNNTKKMKNSGFSLWIRCLEGDKTAFIELEKYNKMDVISLRELYLKFQPWDHKGIRFGLYTESLDMECDCGSTHLNRRGYSYTKTGKFQKLQCQKCGAWHQEKTNLLEKEKKKVLLK